MIFTSFAAFDPGLTLPVTAVFNFEPGFSLLYRATPALVIPAPDFVGSEILFSFLEVVYLVFSLSNSHSSPQNPPIMAFFFLQMLEHLLVYHQHLVLYFFSLQRHSASEILSSLPLLQQARTLDTFFDPLADFLPHF